MNEHAIGDFVEILCRDGKQFEGILQDFDENLVYINGCGFPLEDIVTMERMK